VKSGNVSVLCSLLTKAGTLSIGVVCLMVIGWPVSRSQSSLELPPSFSQLPLTVKTTHLPSAPFFANDREERELRVDLNEAQVADLKKLPGIGDVLAQRIVEFRKTYGHFQSVDDLQAVTGIGKGSIARLRPIVTLSQDAPDEQTVGS